MTEPVEIFALGACLLHGPLGAAMRNGIATSSFSRFSGEGLPSVYTIDEALQLVGFLKGEQQIPPALRRFCSIGPDLDPSRIPAGGLATADIVIIEINSPVEMRYRDLSLVRTDIMERIFAPLNTRGPEVQGAINTWYYRGLLNCEETARQGASEVLAAAVSDDMEDADLIRSIIRETRGRQRDVAGLVEGIGALRDRVGAPLGMMTYTHQYMPDGRPLPWPPPFVDEQIEAATKLGIRYFQPSRVVKSYGVARALAEDRVHYRDEFQPVMGGVLAQFAAEICRQTVSA